ncbi:uncharacterized protein LOC100180356 [Ciona intestinalis]
MLLNSSFYPTTEACNYLASSQEVFPMNRFALEINACAYSDKPFNRVDSLKLAQYMACNPVCLKAAKLYCKRFIVGYADYLKTMKEPATMKTIHKEEEALLYEIDPNVVASYHALHHHQHNEYGKYLAILSYLHNEDIPVFYISRMSQYFRTNNNELSLTEKESLNQHEASVIVKDLLQLVGDQEALVPSKYGCICLPPYIIDSCRADAKSDDCKKNLQCAIEIMIGMISKDNREKRDDMKLFQLRPHIESLLEFAGKYFSLNFELKQQDEVDFMIMMACCRLYNILGQALIQNRITSKWREALDILFTAATYTWNVACSYSCSVGCGLFEMSVPESLEYVIGKNPNKDAKKIAKQCAEAGLKMNEKFIDKFIVSTLLLDKQKLDELEEHAAAIHGKEKACYMLKDVRTAVENHCLLTHDHLVNLRKSGCFLSSKCYRQSFLSEQICSIFHTYGREVLYCHEFMDQESIAKCEYYSQFSQCIAKAISSIITKSSTKVRLGILEEYTTVANCQVPRLLHNKIGESSEETIDRLELAREKIDGLYEIDAQLHQHGLYRKIVGTDYTNLNAMKQTVKANTKLLKFPHTDRSITKLQHCMDMLALALKNINLDMAPNCVIQAAKFLAAYGNYEDSFDTFMKGFDTTKDGKTYGLYHCIQYKPNTFAWAITNYARAVASCYETTGVCHVEHKEHAIKHCRKTLCLQKILDTWKPTLQQHIDTLSCISNH